MEITHKKANRKEKGVLKEISRKLPDIVVPIEVKEFHELNGEMVPEIDMGKIDQKGHYWNLVDLFESEGLAGVQKYVDSVNRRYDNLSAGKAE